MVCRRFRRIMVGVFECWVYVCVVGVLLLVAVVLVARLRWAGQPPERVRCGTPLSWPGQTGRPPERVRCARLCLCFAGVLAPLIVFPFAPSTFLCLRGCRPFARGCPQMLLSLSPPPPVGCASRVCRPSANLPLPSPCFLVAPLHLLAGCWRLSPPAVAPVHLGLCFCKANNA